MLKTLQTKMILWLLMLTMGITACKEDDPAPSATQQQVKINRWILDNMKFWYLWNDKLPSNPSLNQDPETFFTSLLYSEDRFSWIQDNYTELLNSLKGISTEAGYEYALYKENESSNNVIAQVLYVKAASPADQAGLKRGDVITHINEQQIATGNYQTLLPSIRENHSLRYKPLLVDEQKFDLEKTISLNTVVYSENPNYFHSVVTVNERKIGYYVYNLFAAGPDGTSKAYDNEMENIFADFKAQGITDLVVDLRFNSGGSESSATNLGSHIGAGIDDSKIFAKRKYNDPVQEEILNDKDLGTSFLITKFLAKAGNVGNQLTESRVYILTSSRTASASELVINGLKPYMDVFLIGDVTYGKNVGSISLYEEDDPNNTWGLQPIVVKVFNSLDQSDYTNGFSPNVIHKDNNLFIYPLGDAREALLSLAVDQITGVAGSGRIAFRGEPKGLIGHSLDDKKRSFNLVIDKNIPLTTVED